MIEQCSKQIAAMIDASCGYEFSEKKRHPSFTGFTNISSTLPAEKVELRAENIITAFATVAQYNYSIEGFEIRQPFTFTCFCRFL